MPNVFSVEPPRLINIARTLDDCPAIGKDCELIPVHTELKQEAIERHFAQRFKVSCQLFEIQRNRASVCDLYGIAAT